jgi:UDP-glucose:glycoprotein glucosyltransferase
MRLSSTNVLCSMDEPELLEDDHIFMSHPDAIEETVILYGDIGSDNFGAFHTLLMNVAKDTNVRYVLRWKPVEMNTTEQRTEKNLVLSGYGVELALKNTEYLVLDDRDQNNTTSDGSNKQKNATKDDEAEKIVDKNVDAEVLFSAVKSSKLTALKTEQIHDIGLKAAQLIINAQDPLKAFRKLTGDFPKYASHLIQREYDQDLLSEISRSQALGLQPGSSGLWINGIPLNMHYLTPFQLLKLLRSEHNGVMALKKLGLATSHAVELLYSAHRLNEGERKMAWLKEAYDVRDHVAGGRAIVFMNDLEKDNRYRTWPKETFEVG